MDYKKYMLYLIRWIGEHLDLVQETDEYPELERIIAHIIKEEPKEEIKDFILAQFNLCPTFSTLDVGKPNEIHNVELFKRKLQDEVDEALFNKLCVFIDDYLKEYCKF